MLHPSVKSEPVTVNAKLASQFNPEAGLTEVTTGAGSVTEKLISSSLSCPSGFSITTLYAPVGNIDRSK
ncbi:MAG: hypothetical protein BWY05_00352 [Euryarchaeota archaeon ADurb.Bin165]|nr:MAG: hypothetical protein BWY05_00352 [Euryarchaeota archaeon ADurb.Bin165]